MPAGIIVCLDIERNKLRKSRGFEDLCFLRVLNAYNLRYERCAQGGGDRKG
jgi:hypothetical protein